MTQELDAFLSYSSRDSGAAERVREALAGEGVSVWWDQEGIRETDHIPATLRDAIAGTRVTLVLASHSQATSRVCRWELLTSFLEGEARGQDRVLLLPLDDALKNLSSAARTRRALVADADGTYREVARSVRAFLDALPPGHGPVRRDHGELHGLPGTAGARFVGRSEGLLSIFDALVSPFRTADAGTAHGPAVCVLSGMGGIGKTSLALFVAEQIGPTRSLGALWLRASGDAVDNDVTEPGDRDFVYRALTDSALAWCAARVGNRLSEDRLPVDAAARWAAVRDVIGEVVRPGESLLLILDDVPSGMRLDELIPRQDGISVLVTTRDALGSSAGFVTVPLHPFEEFEALTLLAAALDPDGAIRRRGGDVWNGSEDVARELLKEVGYHPLAVDLMATRLQLGDPLSVVADETRQLSDEFLDTPDYLASLPTAHTPSIVATIASSVRGAAGVKGVDVRPLVRLMAVMPAGYPVPRALVTHVLGAKGAAAVRLCQSRNLIRAEAEFLYCHALTRGVSQMLWDRHAAPFASSDGLEPDLTRAAVAWLVEEADRWRDKNVQKAADLARIVLDVLNRLEVPPSTEDRIHRSEAFSALARATYRIGVRSLDDYQTALGWIDDAQAAVSEPESDWERMIWWSAEALRGLVLSAVASAQVQPGLDPSVRDELELEAFEVCNRADLERRPIGDRMLADKPARPSREWIQQVMLRSMFNMPGRHFHRAKALAGIDPPQYESVAEHLDEMDRKHGDVIQRRRELEPENLMGIAAGIAGRGSAAYHRAVLLPRTADERRGDLERAAAFVLESLAIRRDEMDPTVETDTAKSLELLVKTCWAQECLEAPFASVSARAAQALVRAEREVEALGHPGKYLAGPVVAADADSPLRSYRATRSRLIDRLGLEGPDRTVWSAAAVACLEWLVLASSHDMCIVEPRRVVQDFFGTESGPGEARLLAPANNARQGLD